MMFYHVLITKIKSGTLHPLRILYSKFDAGLAHTACQTGAGIRYPMLAMVTNRMRYFAMRSFPT